MPETKGMQLSESAQEARNNALEGIFVPHARKLRDEAYEFEKASSARFVHYTSADAALKIISQKRLWMRSASCMTDYREVQHGFAILQRFFHDEAKRKSFTHAVDEYVPGAADEAIYRFDQWWKLGTFQFKTYIASVSKHEVEEDIHGRLSMWRTFGANAARVGIVLNVPAQSRGAEAMKLIFSPVAYFKDNEAERLVSEVITNIKTNGEFLKTINQQEMIGWIFTMLLIGVTCVKHEGFKEEKEWRVVHCPQVYHSPLISSSTETVGGVPQFVYKLPLDKSVDPILEDLDFAKLFDRLIIGPSPYPAAMFDAFVEVLSRVGVAEAAKKVFVSGIPIRS